MITLTKQMEVMKNLIEKINNISNKDMRIYVTYDSELQFISIFTPQKIFILNARTPEFFNMKLQEANQYLHNFELKEDC